MKKKKYKQIMKSPCRCIKGSSVINTMKREKYSCVHVKSKVTLTKVADEIYKK